MILAPGVARCRFCGGQLPADFWGDIAVAGEGGARLLPVRPTSRRGAPPIGGLAGVGSSAAKPSDDGSGLLNLTGGSGLITLGPAPSKRPGGEERSAHLRASGGSMPPAPGASAASVALQKELEAITAGTARPKRQAGRGITARTPTPTQAGRRDAGRTPTPARVGLFGEKTRWILVALLVGGVIWMLVSGGKGKPSTSALGTCQQRCSAGFKDALEAKRAIPTDEMNWMSGCVQECARPK